MPGLNQKGPMGQGSMTGRRMGRCTNYGEKNRQQPNNDIQNNTQPSNLFDRGVGFGHRSQGRGRGLGLGNRYRGGL